MTGRVQKTSILAPSRQARKVRNRFSCAFAQKIYFVLFVSSFENWGLGMGLWYHPVRHSRMLLAGIQGNLGLDPR